MKLINNENRAYIAYNTTIMPKQIVETTDKKTIDILLKQPGVEEYVDKEDIKKIEEENAKLKKELAKKEIKKATTKKSTKKSEK